MNKWGVQRLFEEIQIAPTTRLTSQNQIGTPKNISRENMTRPGGSKKNVTKTAKIEGFNTRFRIFLGPELRTPRDASKGHGRSLERSYVAWNEYVEAFTFISMQFWVLREMNKWGVQRLFEAMQIAPTSRLTLQVISALLGKCWEEIWPGLHKPKNVPKTAKSEG